MYSQGLPKLWLTWNLTDTIQKMSNSDFDVKRATIQFYENSHNSQSDSWIELKFYVKWLDCFPTLG